MNIFSKDTGMNKVKVGKEFDLFGSSSPSWGEINYYAFDVLSVEFHNELYGFIQAKATLEDDKYCKSKYFDEYLFDKSNEIIKIDQKYKHLKPDRTILEYDTTLPTKIRNIIHHPENEHNEKYTDEELKISIESLISLLSC